MIKIYFTDQQFSDLKNSAEESYRNFGEIFCPVLNSRIIFNTLGLNHLKMKRWNHSRERNDQYFRFKLLHLVPEVIRKSHTLQGIVEDKKFERRRINGRWDTVLVLVTYYEFIAVTTGRRLRVVIKQVENGPLYFWSLIPFWKQKNGTRKMFEGDPETD